ncbi:MAG: lasso peptide biosynthesis B2 protein [Rhodanobacter sp.]|nr:MAG: lasso peptide biosynthesis B2 protein [Rhodanobacter sp.]
MHYRLRENLSCCDVDGHMIFLDVAQDRYFRLTGPLEKAMRHFRAHESVPSPLLDRLATARILVEASDLETNAAIANIQRPSCSAIEQTFAIENRRLSSAVAFEVMTIVFSIRHQLKSCTFKTILDRASAYRGRKVEAHEIAMPTPRMHSLLVASRQFARARRYVPIEPVCFLDSLSLLRFLSRRRLPANIVFGVTPEPFAAHCWVQTGDMVLNETLSEVHAHTPIRIV